VPDREEYRRPERKIRNRRASAPTPREAFPREFEREEWVRPEPAARREAPDPKQVYAAARRRRQMQRVYRRRRFLVVVAGILLLAAIITLLLPESEKGVDPDALPGEPVTGVGHLVAPLPYAGGGGSTAEELPAINWGTVGPVRQTGEIPYTYTPYTAPAVGEALPAAGRVTTQWFADAALLGDSLTEGFCESVYNIDLSGALICGYQGTSPNQIVNRTTLKHPDRGEEIAMDVLVAAQPKKLYILLGTNALAGGASDDGFISYYERMLDELKAALPSTQLYVQSILPVSAETAAEMPGLESGHLAEINGRIKNLCAERGCYFLDLNAEFSDENGNLQAEFAQKDGIHLTVSGYNKWVSYLCTHTPYDKDNPYQPGSEYYLDDAVKALLSDLP